MKRCIAEAPRQTPVAGAWDVVVVGGGIAGVAAAVAAARRGMKTVLLEKEFGLGGLATLGNVVYYLPLCDGKGRKVIAGLGEELLKLSVKDIRKDNAKQSLLKIPDCWAKRASQEERRRTRYRVSYNPNSFMLEMEALLEREGVALWYDTRLVGCQGQGKRLTHVLVENKSGRLALEGKTFIDTTGDADLCAYAGNATDDIDSNVVCGWYYLSRKGGVVLQPFTHRYSPVYDAKDSEGPFYSGVRGRDVTRQVLDTRKEIFARVTKLRREHPQENIYPIMMTSIPSFRVTRRLDGVTSIRDEDKHVWFEDTVGLTGDWRKAGPVWALGLSTLRSGKWGNLFAAGRCMSSDISVWDVMRVIPTCAVTGEAAGAAAAMTIRSAKGDSGKINIAALQKDLKKNGALIDPKLVKAAK